MTQVACDDLLNLVSLFLAEAAIAFEAHGVEPIFRLFVVGFNVDMARLSAIARVEKKSQGTIAKNGRHGLALNLDA